jgi:hypothetical protein
MDSPRRRTRARVAPDADALQSPWIGIALLAVVLVAAYVMAGAPPIVFTGW